MIVSPTRTATCGLETLIRVVDNADSVIAVCAEDGNMDYNTAITLKHAELAGKKVYWVRAR